MPETTAPKMVTALLRLCFGFDDVTLGGEVLLGPSRYTLGFGPERLSDLLNLKISTPFNIASEKLNVCGLGCNAIDKFCNSSIPLACIITA
ncbi:hypothetical protein SADUNF_Sadunf17G0094400 [Salix dunnii]|uniref:Uncharacterized protein n=1 Tax=Salix dunnii TaxID=1413687 RepID=A0A835MF49_9ROSI|nr:hypothetical protein SADUNF_Sadunf17G0094400 [Salix dunnii]